MRPSLPLFLACCAGECVADTLTAIDSGFYNAAGRHAKYDGVVLGAAGATFNYSVGSIDDAPLGLTDVFRKNYFTFDLSAYAPGDIVSGSLELFMPASGDPEPSGGYGSPDASETYELWGTGADSAGMTAFADALTEVHDITDGSPGGGLETASMLFGMLADLADAPAPSPGVLGTTALTEADEGTFVTVPLTPDGVDYLNTFAGGTIVMGGLITSLSGVGDGDDDPTEYGFGFTEPLISGVLDPDPSITSPTPIPTLDIEVVPEPAGLAMVLGLLALLCVGTKRRRRGRA